MRPTTSRLSGARPALALLLFINLFNYVDRQVLAAVVPSIEHSFFGAGASGGSSTLQAIQDWCRVHLGFKPELALIGVLVHGVHGPVHDRRADFRPPRRALFALGARRRRRRPLEPGQRRLGPGGDVLRAPADPLPRRRRGGGVRAGGADDPLRPLSGRAPRPDPRLVLHGDPGGQRARLRARRRRGGLVHRRPRRPPARDPRRELALGVLPRRAARHRCSGSLRSS